MKKSVKTVVSIKLEIIIIWGLSASIQIFKSTAILTHQLNQRGLIHSSLFNASLEIFITQAQKELFLRF